MEHSTLCQVCKTHQSSKIALQRHVKNKHEKNWPEYYVDTQLNGNWPLCNCGCKTKLKWKYGKLWINNPFGEYIIGHIARINNNYTKNPDTLKKSIATRKKMAANGEIIAWNAGKTYEELKGKEWSDKFKGKISNNKERAKKISKALKGKPKSEEHKRKISIDRKKYWSDAKHREAQRARRVDYHKNRCKTKETLLEKRFAGLLDMMNITYEKQFELTHLLYDFRINDTNIIIEVDGDFYHCNPIEWPEPKYPIQKNTVRHDKLKNARVKDNGYRLLRFWETDVNTRPEWCMQQIRELLSV